jgi:hypothetical protein
MPAEMPEPVKPIDVPVYTGSFDTARDNGETDKWHQNRHINIDCAAAIDKAVSDNNPELYHYDLKTAAKTVLAEYGAERVNFVLASAVVLSYNDGRFSASNRAWAKDFDVPFGRPTFVVNTHKAILDGFIDRVREAGREKPSLLEALKTNEQKSKAMFAANPEPAKDKQKTNNGMEV